MRAVLTSILMLACGERAESSEKYWIAKNADAVIIGQLREVSAVRITGGWRFRGTLVVEEVLFGPVIPLREIAYSFTCSCCPTSRRPPMEAVTKDRKLWFLNRHNKHEWTSAGSCSDAGFRSIEYRDEMRKFLRSRDR